MRARVHVFISGRVQGVFFRHEIRKRATSLNLTGWVRNLPDGRVEAIFEGEREAVEEILEFCRRGPPGALVRNVETRWEEPKCEFSSFQIRY
ncbi:MAG: acylphosphatase [Candidatus Bathyarchaeota archaeon]|nr:acylphosphatase [Candidatus Bathyarchaeota archaeon]